MPHSSLNERVPPGVVTGQHYRLLLEVCRRKKYALPAINVTNISTINATLEAAARNQSDVVIQISSGGALFFAGANLTNTHQARVLGALSIARHVHLMAKEYGIAVILHTDHAERSLIPWLNDLITLSETEYAKTGQTLFSSHMLDLSAEPIDSNLKEAETILRRLTPIGMGLEIELGMTGGEEDGIGQEYDTHTLENAAFYTQPTDVLKAWEKLSPLGTVSIAASFGNVHGVYKPGHIKLRPDILKKSQDLVIQACGGKSTPLPFVFHGGSGSEISHIHEAIKYGVIKVNIDTDIQFALSHGVGAYIHRHNTAFEHQIDPTTGLPLKKYYDPRAWLRAGEIECVHYLDNIFSILKSKGKSLAHSPSL